MLKMIDNPRNHIYRTNATTSAKSNTERTKTSGLRVDRYGR